jgi:hypothetical protein
VGVEAGSTGGNDGTGAGDGSGKAELELTARGWTPTVAPIARPPVAAMSTPISAASARR